MCFWIVDLLSIGIHGIWPILVRQRSMRHPVRMIRQCVSAATMAAFGMDHLYSMVFAFFCNLKRNLFKNELKVQGIMQWSSSYALRWMLSLGRRVRFPRASFGSFSLVSVVPSLLLAVAVAVAAATAAAPAPFKPCGLV